MRLKVMNCKSCNAPLHLEEGKLVCAFCGASYAGEKDAEDIEYEKTVNAEEYILQSLKNETSQLNEYYRKVESEIIANEKALEEAERIKRRKILKKSIISGISTCIVFCVIAVLVVVVAQIAIMADEKNTAQARERAIEKAANAVTTRVTKTELENAKDVLNEIDEMVYDFEDNAYKKNEIRIDGGTWTLSGKPQIVSRYLLTYEKKCTVYSFVKVVFTGEDGSEKEVYSCVAVDGLTVDKNGKVSLDPKKRAYELKASDYNLSWHGGFDGDLLYEEVIMKRRIHPEEALLFYYEL